MASGNDYIEDGTPSSPQKPSTSLSLLYMLSLAGVIVGSVISFSYPLQALDLGAPYPVREYYWNRVQAGDNTYHYSDGADYQTQVCWYGGEVLIAFMVIALVAAGLGLIFHIGEICACVQGTTKHQAVLAAFAAITYTISMANWGSSCLNLTRVNNESTTVSQSFTTSGYIIVVVFNAFALAGLIVGWKRHQEAFSNRK